MMNRFTGTSKLTAARGENAVAPEASKRGNGLFTVRGFDSLRGLIGIALATAVAFWVGGYHPFTEDGGTYAVSVEWLLNRRLFPWGTNFVVDHVRWSAFSYGTAALVRCTHLSLDVVLLLLYLASSAGMLAAGLFFLNKLGFRGGTAWMGVFLLAALWTLPVAGTSLMLVDQYMTARNFSTPLSLLALGWALEDWRARPRAAIFCGGALLLAAVFHPMMGVYALGQIVVLRMWAERRRWALLLAFACATLVGAWVLQHVAPAESPAMRVASITRYFWFLKRWQWYELIGLAGPLAALAAALWKLPKQGRARRLLWAMTAYASIAIVCSLVFCHEDSRAAILMRLQPLRVYLLIYAVLPLVLGAALAKRMEAKRWGAVALGAVFAVSCVAMFAAQRSTYANSPHVESPWTRRPNEWAAAFLWVRQNTPVDALFALDADYINAHGEDAHEFRTIAERNALADRAKDGGEVAAMRPELADTWIADVALTTGLDGMSDRERDARLLPRGVAWVVLTRTAATGHPCPYENDVVKVCRIGVKLSAP